MKEKKSRDGFIKPCKMNAIWKTCKKQPSAKVFLMRHFNLLQSTQALCGFSYAWTLNHHSLLYGTSIQSYHVERSMGVVTWLSEYTTRYAINLFRVVISKKVCCNNKRIESVCVFVLLFDKFENTLLYWLNIGIFHGRTVKTQFMCGFYCWFWV